MEQNQKIRMLLGEQKDWRQRSQKKERRFLCKSPFSVTKSTDSRKQNTDLSQIFPSQPDALRTLTREMNSSTDSSPKDNEISLMFFLRTKDTDVPSGLT